MPWARSGTCIRRPRCRRRHKFLRSATGCVSATSPAAMMPPQATCRPAAGRRTNRRFPGGVPAVLRTTSGAPAAAQGGGTPGIQAGSLYRMRLAPSARRSPRSTRHRCRPFLVPGRVQAPRGALGLTVTAALRACLTRARTMRRCTYRGQRNTRVRSTRLAQVRCCPGFYLVRATAWTWERRAPCRGRARRRQAPALTKRHQVARATKQRSVEMCKSTQTILSNLCHRWQWLHGNGPTPRHPAHPSRYTR